MSAGSIDQLIDALQCLPGIGPKSAQRITYRLLQHQRNQGIHLAEKLKYAMEHVTACRSCQQPCDGDLCSICQDTKRSKKQLCIVEQPSDLLAMEQTQTFNGQYFVLMGHLSPLDGVGPDELGLPSLHHRLDQGFVEEIILATNPTIEGQATASYIAQMAKPLGIACSRIAHGVPMGGELEYLDGRTLAMAYQTRRLMTDHDTSRMPS